MFDELLKLPGVQNAPQALLWFLTIAAVVIASLPHIVTLVNQNRNAKKERDAEGAQASQAKTSQFESISAAEARLRQDVFKERDRIQERFDALEKRYDELGEQYETLEGKYSDLLKQYETLQRQYDTLLAKTTQSQKTLERIERNTENG